MNANDLREDVELKIVTLIKSLLAKGRLTDARAQAIAQQVLEMITPGMSVAQIYRTVPKLDETMPELAPVVTPFAREYEKRIVREAQNQVSTLIRQGQFDAAADLAKKAVAQEITMEWAGVGKPDSAGPDDL